MAEVRAAQTTLQVDADGFPVPGALPEGILEDCEIPEDGVFRFGESARGGLSPEFATPITSVTEESAPVRLEAPEVEITLPPSVFSEGVFGDAAALTIAAAYGRPVIDPAVPAPAPIDVGVEPFADVDLDSPVGSEPLIRPSKDERDFSSTPLWSRQIKPDNALCKSCKHSAIIMHVQPARSQTWTPMRVVLLCKAFDPKHPRDVTETTILHCSEYEKDESKAAETRTFAQIADDIRARHKATSPPR